MNVILYDLYIYMILLKFQFPLILKFGSEGSNNQFISTDSGTGLMSNR